MTGLLGWLADVGPGDGFDTADMFWWITGLVAVASLYLLVSQILLPLHRAVKWFANFREDWDGTPAREGRDAVPSMPARMRAVDGELSRNSGSSLKDVAYETKRQVGVIEERQVAVVAKVDGAIEKLDDMAEQISALVSYVRKNVSDGEQLPDRPILPNHVDT